MWSLLLLIIILGGYNMFMNMFKYEFKRLTSLRITYIFAPIFLFVCIAYNLLMGIALSDYGIDLSSVLRDGCIGIFFLGICWLIPYFIGSATQEFKNGSMRLTLLAFPNRKMLLLAKYLFTYILGMVIYFIGIFIGLFTLVVTLSLGKKEDIEASYFNKEFIIFFLYYFIFISIVITFFFIVTIFTRNALPSIVSFFGWILFGQWIVGGILQVLIGDSDSRQTFQSFIPFVGFYINLVFDYSQESGLWKLSLSAIITMLTLVAIYVGVMYVFEKRDPK